ncbi:MULTISPECIES: type IV pilin-like G/H family protein [Moorena]|uniref:Secretion pathway protein n=1 Tax=Moorena producens 3L TaxID=489825 RepID=F4Y2V5_9CYAN|nr:MULTISPECIES: type IV pilin-like G/H family protein [Moorena]EGJ28949.1 secretion pathway protein [Moorena producens 3L]NEP67531.1 prepilin-type N-terminal cleavage/methylation domain-containing protein [Moorena sp. SIO3A5]OLT66573.1 general secretion pathway protein GspH [Moorena producens 3L]
MKTDLKVKLLQHLTQKKQDEGFTLIELLVVIIIIGILSAIALPSFLNQANKAKQSEARTYVGSMNRSQQAYYLENDEFVTDETNFGELGLGVATQTKNYIYGVQDGGTPKASVSNYGDPATGAGETDTDSSLKAYQGVTALGEIAETSEATTLAVLCETKKAVGIGGVFAKGLEANVPNDQPQCADENNWRNLSGK